MFFRFLGFTLPVLAMTAVAACDRSPLEADPAAASDLDLHAQHPAGVVPSSVLLKRDVSLMRAGSVRFQGHDKALAEGFVELSECVALPPELGGAAMGYHFGHPARLADPSVDPLRPEILLYAPAEGGGLELVGVEFMVNAEAWWAAGNQSPPSVAGHEFEEPNPQHPDPAVAAAYTLHVWVWRDNPDGLFTPFNPDVSCG